MTFVIPTENNLHNVDRSTNARFLADINTPTNAGTKNGGNLPISNVSGEWDNNTNGAVKGVAYELFASQATRDVSVDTLLFVWHHQFNAPNRLQIDVVANGGVRCRIYSGTGSPPTDYKEYYLGGNDTPFGDAIKGPVSYVIDMNDTSHEASGGTFNNTLVTSYACVVDRLNMVGTATNWNYNPRLYVFATTKASADTPTFSGSSSGPLDAVTLIQGTTFTNKLGNWVRQRGTAIFIDVAFRIGNNSTITTFDDDGLTIISPVSDDPADPKNRLTVQACRTYLNLRNNVLDTADFSGTWIWGTRALFDWDQDDLAVVTFASPTFRGMGRFTLGSSITGPATWDDVDPVVFADTGVDVDGSIFKSPNGSHALEMTAGAMDIANQRFESYASKHAILISTAGTYNLSNVFFDESGTNEIETTHASGVVTLNISNGGTVPGVTVTGAGTVVVNNNKTVQVTVKDQDDANIQNARVLIEAAAGGALPFDDTVTITRSGSTASVSHTAHGMADGQLVTIRKALEQEYNGVYAITNVTTNAYDYTVSGTPATPATGTIKATAAIVSELTSAGGVADNVAFNYSADQPISGVASKSSAAPFYKAGRFTGTIGTGGFSTTLVLVLDE